MTGIFATGLFAAALGAAAQGSQALVPPAVVADRYIVEFVDQPVVRAAFVIGAAEAWRGEGRERRLNPDAPAVREYRRALVAGRDQVLQEMESALARRLTVHHRFEYVANGVSVTLQPVEVDTLRRTAGVRSVRPVTAHRLQTDAGPGWISAPQAWASSGAMGEGVVVGVIDSGVNWDHPAFADVAGDGYNHTNPRGRSYGLCSNAAVACNDKLIGVYDFTEEGNRLGRDVDGHGSHVASTAVGNQRMSNLAGITANLSVPLSGVAPRANLISYKVCVADDPDTSDDDNVCFLDAIIQAYDQAVADQVDIVNYSVGGSASDPWRDADSLTMLNARSAGILLVTSAGNGGPGPGTLSSPANAPWMLAVANISHNRRFENVLDNLTGGNATPPGDLAGVGFTAGFGPAAIVHAADFGNALCGTGAAELQSRCDEHSGASNPFAPGTFNGQIVVCDRGTYGRVEKGFNLRAAGAGGYILANTAEQGESVVSDDHCLPGVHLGSSDGDRLRAWLAAGGADRSGRIAGQAQALDDAFGDRVASSSSRGPDSVIAGLLKPEIGAPGSNILAASVSGAGSEFKSGTSMASPHVAGAAAVLLSANPDLSAAQLHSILVTTARNDGMTDDNGGGPADGFATGTGRADVLAATRAGLAMNVTRAQFLAADPAVGGNPAELNLPGLVDNSCFQTCEFTRQLTALAGGRWETQITSADGLSGTVTPAAFELAANESITLRVTVDASNPVVLNRWTTGYVELTPADAGLSSQRLTLQIRSEPGALPQLITVRSPQNSGSQLVPISGIAGLPQARFDTLGLAQGGQSSRNLREDPTRADPYDSLAINGGVFFELVEMAAGGGAVIARTVPGDNGDLDLFVGRDNNGNGLPDAAEEICRSTSPVASELCVIENAASGRYWVLVQNWSAFGPASLDATVLRYAAVASSDRGLIATGPGNTPALATLESRLIWDRGDMQTGQVWFGMLLPRAQPGTALGAIPVELIRTDDGQAGTATTPDLTAKQALALRHNHPVDIALAAGQGHGRAYIDLPASASQMTIEIDAPAQIDTLVVREAARFAAPQVPAVASIDAPVATLSGSQSVTLDVTAGRYYIVPVNRGATAQVAGLQIAVSHSGNSLTPVQGLWFNPARDGAGFNLNLVDGQLIIEWYTYLEDGTPIWYLAQAPFTNQADEWQADLNYFSWDGQAALATTVGSVRLTLLSATSLIFNYELNGMAGSEPYSAIIADLSCDSNGPVVERTGLWFIPSMPGFGYSILSVAGQQVHINYLYGPTGLPRWVLGQATEADTTIALSQFGGFCPFCATQPVSAVPAGSNQLFYTDAVSGSVATDVQFVNPLAGQWQQTGDVANLTPQPVCGN